jgi:hypothetical protein
MRDHYSEPSEGFALNSSYGGNSGDGSAPGGEGSPNFTPGNSLPTMKTTKTRNTAIVVVPVLLVLVTFLFWYQTWFGKQLSHDDLGKYLSETSAPHKTQHALSQLAQEMARRDPAARQWYPLVVRLADNKEAQLRLMAAWVMGQDNETADFHRTLLKLLGDPEAMVRWNAALALVRFGDPAGQPELRFMLRPYSLLAPQPGRVTFRLKEQKPVTAGSLVARIKDSDQRMAEVRSPLAGQIERQVVKDGAPVETGQEIATISPGWEQAWEALRALYLVGKPSDLDDVQRLARGVAGMPHRVQQQAILTAQAIRARAETVDEPSRQSKAVDSQQLTVDSPR